MRTRNSDTPKPATAKKTPPPRKSATKTPPNPPDSGAGLDTPKSAEAKRPPATKAKPVRKNETATPPSTGSDSKPQQSSVAEEPKASGDGAQVTPGTKVVKVTKKVVKRMSGRAKTPTSAKGVTTQTPKSGESVKAKVEESREKEDLEEATVENVGESGKNEETVTEVGEPVVENTGDSARKEGTVMEVEETVVESSVEVEEPVAENISVSAKKEESAMEVQIAAIANVGDSVRREEPVVEEVAKSAEDEETDGAKDGEEVIEEKEEDTRGVGNNEEPNVDPVNMGENVIEDFREEDAQFVKEYGSDEGIEDYGDRVDLGEHGEDELVEDDPEEPAEYDPEEPAEYNEGLEEECRELTAVAKERKIKKEHEIFVGGLDRDAEEEDVRKVFERIGEVVEVRLHRDPSTNKNKGYAFVKFANKEHAQRALSEMKNPVIHGKRCGTAPSEDNDSLFLGNICNTWTKEAIKQKLKEYDVEGVENITLVPDVQHEGLSRGFAFLEFSCHAEAMLAYKRLQKPDVVFGHPERTAKVAFAEPLREPDPAVMAQVKSIFLDGLPPHWDEDHVREQLKGYGEIARIVLARNMSTAKRKDFGFVDFSTHEAAVASIAGINNSQLGDGKMKVKARLSNPLPKTQAVKGGMCGGFRIGHGNGGATSNFGRGFGRGGQPFHRANFQRNRGFYQGGRGQTSRMGFPNKYDNPYNEFHGRQFTGRGGRRDSYRGGNYASGVGRAVTAPSRPNLDRPWHGAPYRGSGMHFPSRRQPYSPERHFDRPFIGRHFDEPFFYDDDAHGMKRPFYMTDPDPDYMEPNRFRPRLDYADTSAFRANSYRDAYGAGSSTYPHDYYGPDYGGGPYSSFYGSDRPYGSGYYY
ncbi:uncharacterized protein LOC132168715 isoform X2 [Corylus avellana]|uniref:uncharacterized protein LOC132168715 isoform X2 n=1 Tax=Corylus avellana TaxID=13451 RepID=UPI00286BC6F5|nr:uncharacterized protein LOC132168715 isoform X2 [Corylus avellana]